MPIYLLTITTLMPLAIKQLVLQLINSKVTFILAFKLEIIQAINILFSFYFYFYSNISTLPKANKYFALNKKYFYILKGSFKALLKYY